MVGKKYSDMTGLAGFGFLVNEFASSIVQYLRNALLLKISPNLKSDLVTGFTSEQTAKITQQTTQFEEKHLQKITVYFADAENKMKYASIVQHEMDHLEGIEFIDKVTDTKKILGRDEYIKRFQ